MFSVGLFFHEELRGMFKSRRKEEGKEQGLFSAVSGIGYGGLKGRTPFSSSQRA